MQRIQLGIIVVALALLCTARLSMGSTDLRWIPAHGPDGPTITLESRDDIGGGDTNVIGPIPTASYDLLWHRFLADPINTSTGTSEAAGAVIVGNYLNAPKQAELIPLIGDGTPAWVSSGNEFYVDAARRADLFAAIDYTPADSTATVKEWSSGSSLPNWSYAVHGCRPLTNDGWASGKGVQVSDDGSTIAVLVNRFAPGGLDGRLVIFDAGSSVPAVVYDLPDGSASALAITPDGAYVAIYAWPFIYVYDRFAETLRWSGSAGSGNDALAISGNGQRIAWGWSTLNVREWNGTSYQPIWTFTRSGYYLTECALDGGGGTLALAWYDAATTAQQVVELYTLPDHGLLWSYSYGPSLTRPLSEASDLPARSVVEVVSELVWSPNGQYLAAASWGGTSPELHVFDRSSAVPEVVLDAPGTLFDVDIVDTVSGVYVSAAGKHVHAGQSGRGADAYALWISSVSDVESNEAARSSTRIEWVGPVPSRGHTWIELHLRGAGSTRLSIVDAAGRSIAELSPPSTLAGAARVRWDGADPAGRVVPPGVYFVVLEEGGGDQRTKARAGSMIGFPASMSVFRLREYHRTPARDPFPNRRGARAAPLRSPWDHAARSQASPNSCRRRRDHAGRTS